ncbi:MAG TPA: hypothetical protein VMV79_03455 [Alphaproteobacteria bacterium]|nr:hypothetical protein [Alphaproteobacteria bacterium]
MTKAVKNRSAKSAKSAKPAARKSVRRLRVIEGTRPDGEDDPLPGRRPSRAFKAALAAVGRMGLKKKGKAG